MSRETPVTRFELAVGEDDKIIILTPSNSSVEDLVKALKYIQMLIDQQGTKK